MMGAITNWDKERLAEKHHVLDQLGAKHITLFTTCGSKIDACYFAFDAFVHSIQKLGGTPKLFCLNKNEPNIYQAIPFHFYAEGRKIEGLYIPKDPGLIPLFCFIKTDYESAGFRVIKNNQQELYIVKPEDAKYLLSQKFKLEKSSTFPTNFKIKPILSEISVSGFYFDHCSPNIKNIFQKLKIDTPWSLHEIDGKLFLIENSKFSQLSILADLPCIKNNPENLKMIDLHVPLFEEKSTILLSMNQTAIYESCSEEIFHLLLLGLNVFVYNNSQKGLSEGFNDKQGIYNSIETAYAYLTQVLNIPEESIIAKGQCFGAAPTLHLGMNHKKISLWIDQAPLNIKDVIENIAKNSLEDVEEDLRDRNLNLLKRLSLKTYSSILSSDFILGLVQKSIFDFEGAQGVQANQGHKLLTIDIPDENGNGGDHLVPESHPGLFLDTIQPNSASYIKLGVIPGGEHVTPWYLSEKCYVTVSDFLQKTNLGKPIFKEEETHSEEDLFLEKLAANLKIFNELEKKDAFK